MTVWLPTLQPPRTRPPPACAFAYTRNCVDCVRARGGAEREWEQFHTPRNLALALTGEVGELCEIFQWKGEVEPGLPGVWRRARGGSRAGMGCRYHDSVCMTLCLSEACAGFSEEEKVHVGEEMSDVLLYLTRMAGEETALGARTDC